MRVNLECIINIFTVIDGNINLLVKSDESLITVSCLDDLDFVCNKYINENIKIKNLSLNQCHTFSDKEDSLNISIVYVGIINKDDIELNDNFKFKIMSSLDYNNKYISKSIEYLKQNLVLTNTIKKIFSNEFVLPELQKTYENLFNLKYDRRNFRKKLIKLNIIEYSNKYSKCSNGRPAKLYRFKDVEDNKIII